MKYFCFFNDIEGTCYHEFYRGKWDNMEFWNEKSLFIHDEVISKIKLDKALKQVLLNYDRYSNTQITRNDWHLICEYVEKNLSKEAKNAIDEIEDWMKNVFENEGVLTILGI